VELRIQIDDPLLDRTHVAHQARRLPRRACRREHYLVGRGKVAAPSINTRNKRSSSPPHPTDLAYPTSPQPLLNLKVPLYIFELTHDYRRSCSQLARILIFLVPGAPAVVTRSKAFGLFRYASVRVCFGSTTAAGVHRLWIAEHHLACRALSHGLRHRMLVECRPARAQSTTPPDHSSALPTQRGQMLELSDREVVLPIDSDVLDIPIGSLAH
jgi:hypothetical protein